MLRGSGTDRSLACAALLAVAVGVLGDVYFVLGRTTAIVGSPFGLLWPGLAAVALAAIAAIGWRRLASDARPSRLLLAALLLPMAAFWLALLLLPPVARDELTHHLAIPALYLEHGRIVEIPFADQSYYPMLLEMFYTPLLAWLPENTPKLLHLLFGLAAAAVVVVGSPPSAARSTGILAGLLLLWTPIVALAGPTAYVDLGLLLYSAVAVATLLRWFETERHGWFVLSALATGFACTVKYNGLLVLVVLTAGTALAPAQRRRLPAAVAVALVYFMIALVPLAPWLIKNAVETGNPVFPLFNGLFGGRALPERPALDIFTRRRFLHGESWWEIAAVPLRIFLTGRDGSPAQFDGVLNPIFLLGIAAACWPGRGTRTRRVLLGFSGAYFLLAFFQTDMRVRYLLPILPALAWLAADFLGALRRTRPRTAAALVAAALLFTGVHLVEKWQRTAPLAYLLGGEDRSAYVARFVPELPVLEYANTHLPERARVYLAFLGTRSYYCRRPFTYETYYSGATLRRSVENSRHAADVLANLRTEGITHMIAADSLLASYLTHNLDGEELDRWRVFASAHLRRLESRNGISLYEIG